MKEELLDIENGRIEIKGNAVFTDLNLHLYKKQILGMLFDSIVERKYLEEFFQGDLCLSQGRILMEGNKSDTLDVSRYLKDKVTIIKKESKLMSNLHIEENIFVFADKKNLINRRRYQRELLQLIKLFHLELNIYISVNHLTVKERVIVELLKAYAEKKSIVILTHITGFLKRNEQEEIFLILKQMQEQGMSFILVEQFENIIFEWTEQVAVIRHGKTVGIFESKTINREQLYSALIRGRNTKNISSISQVEIEEDSESKSVLKFEHVFTNVLNDFNLEIGAGEVLKIYYMDDDSFEHIIELLKGSKKPVSGKIMLSDHEYKVNSVVQAVAQGVCFVEESPYDNMLFYNMSVRDNLSLALSKKVPLFWFRSRFVKSVDQLVKTVSIEDIARIKLRKLEPRILQLLAYYKWYLYGPKVVVCIKPFTETDIHLQEITVEMISNLRLRNIAVILLTSNYSELYRIDGDTIYLKNGQTIDEDEVYQTLYKE